MLNLYARATQWLDAPHLERRIALLAFVCSLPSLGMGLHADDYVLHRNLRRAGPLEAYTFFSRDAPTARAQLIEQRNGGGMPWWADENPRTSYFRPFSSLSLWLDFASGLPPWWMHLQNCAIYAGIVWLAVALYRQLGLSGAGLGWAALFFALDCAIATSVGWVAARNTLLASCFGFACILVHDHARRRGRAALLALSCLCFALSLLSAELGLCTLGYLAAHALTIDRAPALRRVLALLPYGLLTSAYLAHYLIAGYGVSGGGMSPSTPAGVLLAGLESVPVWLATTASFPIASFQLLLPNFRVPLLVFSFAALAILLPPLARWIREPGARMLAIGALLSLVPLAATLPQERLRFFVSFGVYGLLGPWIADDFIARERFRRLVARFVWAVHGVLLPLFFVPNLFSISAPFTSGSVRALDRALPPAKEPVAIVLNPPAWSATWFQVAMRAFQGSVEPPVYALYAGGQSLEIERLDDRSLELRVARGWFAAPFERIRNLERSPYRAGDRIDLPAFDVEVREVDTAGAPTRVRFRFDRALEDSDLAFHAWEETKVVPWRPPPAGGRVQLAAAKAF